MRISHWEPLEECDICGCPDIHQVTGNMDRETGYTDSWWECENGHRVDEVLVDERKTMSDPTEGEP